MSQNNKKVVHTIVPNYFMLGIGIVGALIFCTLVTLLWPIVGVVFWVLFLIFIYFVFKKIGLSVILTEDEIALHYFSILYGRIHETIPLQTISKMEIRIYSNYGGGGLVQIYHQDHISIFQIESRTSVSFSKIFQFSSAIANKGIDAYVDSTMTPATVLSMAQKVPCTLVFKEKINKYWYRFEVKLSTMK